MYCQRYFTSQSLRKMIGFLITLVWPTLRSVKLKGDRFTIPGIEPGTPVISGFGLPELDRYSDCPIDGIEVSKSKQLIVDTCRFRCQNNLESFRSHVITPIKQFSSNLKEKEIRIKF